jgi:hypothetical protein
MSDSNLGRDTKYPEDFRGFTQSLWANSGSALNKAKTNSIYLQNHFTITQPYEAVAGSVVK